MRRVGACAACHVPTRRDDRGGRGCASALAPAQLGALCPPPPPPGRLSQNIGRCTVARVALSPSLAHTPSPRSPTHSLVRGEEPGVQDEQRVAGSSPARTLQQRGVVVQAQALRGVGGWGGGGASVCRPPPAADAAAPPRFATLRNQTIERLSRAMVEALAAGGRGWRARTAERAVRRMAVPSIQRDTRAPRCLRGTLQGAPGCTGGNARVGGEPASAAVGVWLRTLRRWRRASPCAWKPPGPPPPPAAAAAAAARRPEVRCVRGAKPQPVWFLRASPANTLAARALAPLRRRRLGSVAAPCNSW